MIDLAEIFEGYAESLGWVFSYGTQSNLNLLASDLEDGQIYLLVDPIKESEISSQYGGNGLITYSGNFLLVVKSDLDNVYHSQDGKYEKNIKPIKRLELPKLKDLIDCSNMTRKRWEVLEVINQLDVNLDGVVVTFEIENL